MTEFENLLQEIEVFKQKWLTTFNEISLSRERLNVSYEELMSKFLNAYYAEKNSLNMKINEIFKKTPKNLETGRYLVPLRLNYNETVYGLERLISTDCNSRSIN